MNIEEKSKELASLISWAYALVNDQLLKVLKWETDNKHMLRWDDSALRIERGGWQMTGITVKNSQLQVRVEFDGWEYGTEVDYPVDETWADKIIQEHCERYNTKQKKKAEEMEKKEKEAAEEELRVYERLKLKFESAPASEGELK